MFQMEPKVVAVVSKIWPRKAWSFQDTALQAVLKTDATAADESFCQDNWTTAGG
jgi:hypothetical protein